MFLISKCALGNFDIKRSVNVILSNLPIIEYNCPINKSLYVQVCACAYSPINSGLYKKY